jgi:ABC-type cobalt transport system substrate-binding protein
VITLGSRSFAGPFMAPLWSPPKGAGVYAVMAPGWRLLTFRALDFEQAADLAEPQLLKRHPKYREWLTIVGTEWNLYVATHELAFSTGAERGAALRELARQYRPEFTPIAPPEMPSLRTLLLDQALRTNKG